MENRDFAAFSIISWFRHFGCIYPADGCSNPFQNARTNSLYQTL